METKNHYWVLDCILGLTALALGAAALCSFVELAVPPQSGTALSIEVLVCVAAMIVGVLFAGFLSRGARLPVRRGQIRAHQERHALMMRRESQGVEEIALVAPPVSSEPIYAKATPETLLVTSLTDVKAQLRVARRRQARRGTGVAVAAVT